MTFSEQQKSAWQAAGTSAIETFPEFEALFQENWTRVCTLIFHLVGDWAEAEDLALDAFWKLYNQPPKSEHNLSGWLYRVASNLGINALRARKRRLRYETEAGMAALESDPSKDTSTLVEREQQRQRVRLVLASMKSRSAQVLILRYSGLSYEEIADALQVSAGSIGTLLARAEKEFEKRYRDADNR